VLPLRTGTPGLRHPGRHGQLPLDHAPLPLVYIKPTGPQTTVEVVDYYFLDKDMTAQRKARIDYANDILQVEDNNLCEGVQRGLRSRGYVQGRFIVDEGRTQISEHAVHHFHRLYLEAMGD
jgi:choline monooxygenase